MRVDELDDDGERDEALVAEDPPRLQRLLAHVADVEPVDVDVADRHAAHDRGLAVDQVDHDAVLGEQHPVAAHAGLLGQRGVRAQVPPLAVHRHEVARLGHVEQRAQLAGRRVPGDVHPRGLLVHDGRAQPGQPVDHLVDGGLVARAPATTRGRRCRRRSMVTWWWSPRAIRPSADSGSPCEPVDTSTTCSGGIAAASSSETISPGAHVQQAEVAGDAHVAHHRAADERDLAAVRLGAVEHLLDAVHVAGEAGRR